MKQVAFRVAGVLAGLVFAGAGLEERLAFSSVLSSGERAVLAPVTEYQQHGAAGAPTSTAELQFTTAAGQQMVVKYSFPEVVLEDFQRGVPVEIVCLAIAAFIFI